MTASPSPSQIRQQQIDYYASFLAKLPGTYQGNLKKYDGQSWPSLYRKIMKQNQSADPLQVADAILGLEAAQKLGEDTSAADDTLAGFVKQAGPDINQGLADTPGVKAAAEAGDALSGIDAVGQFFNDLRDASTWIRVGKIVAGSALLLIGLAKLTGFSKGIAGKAVKAAPFL